MEQIRDVIQKTVKELFDLETHVLLTRPDEQYGDITTNVALQLSAQLGRSPREIAEHLSAALEHELLLKKEVAGPGFINIWLTDEALISLSQQLPEKRRDNKTVVIETNNPNPFKAMHIGHAFNAILGDTIANLIEADGAHTYRVSYHGDVGSHVGKSMYSLLRFVNGDSARLDTIQKQDRNSFMSHMYAEGALAFKEDPEAKEEIESLSKQSFTREDPVYADVYEICKAWSFEQIDEIVEKLGNKSVIQRFLESDADARGVPIVRAHVPQIFQESDGAVVFKGSEHGSFDNVFISARGLGLYGARDIGLIKLKHEQYHPDKSYIVTAEEQRDYFKGVLAAADLCMPESKGVTENISTGTVKLTTGKMSSRTGDVVEISWLFERIAEAIVGRGGEPSQELIAGALRYQFLKVRIGHDVVFDIAEAVSLQGNSGAYLQYAHARACSILRKKQPADGVITELQPAERSLVRKIGEYHEIVGQAAHELMPHYIANYLYELAQNFNKFYEGNRVIDDERQEVRLMLVAAYARTLKQGLELLGIHAPESM